MGVEFCVWIFVVTFLSKSLLVQSTIEINVGHFHMPGKHPGKHPKLWQCAETVLKQNEYVGGRMSIQTGVCEGLSRSWGRNQTTESGYVYVKKYHVYTNFEQPVEVLKKRWYIPGVLNTGAKVDVYLTTPKADKWIIHIGLTEVSTATHTEYNLYLVAFDTVNQEVTFIEQDEDLNKDLVYDRRSKIFGQQISSSVRYKISFVAEGNSLKVLWDDELLERTSLSIIRVNYLTEVFVLSGMIFGLDDVSAVVHGFGFTEA